MADLFLQIVNRSFAAFWLILAVVALRPLLKKAPRWIFFLLWGMVAIRLVVPISLESILSLIPSAEVVSPDIMLSPTPEIQTGISSINTVINPIITDSFAPNPFDSANPLQIWIPVASALWIAGIVTLGIYAAVSYGRLRFRIAAAVHHQDNIYYCQNVDSPFVLGLIKPRIYLPTTISEKEVSHVIAHEQAHIARRDHWWKPFAFVILMIHWFNPLVWLSYILLCRDIEFACDERVIRELQPEQRADYSQALLNCSIVRRRIQACPLAFGEAGVKQRVKSVLLYKKPEFWIIIAALIACCVVAVCFLTNPKQEAPNLGSIPENYTLQQAKQDGCVVMENDDVTSGQEVWYNFYHQTQKGISASVRYITYFDRENPSSLESPKTNYPHMYVHDLIFDGKTYTVRWFEDGKEIVRHYRYLMLYTGAADTPSAVFRSYARYVLTNDNTVTWEDIFAGLVSSQAVAYIDHLSVYSDLVYKSDPTLYDLEKAKTALEPYMHEYQIATLDANEFTGTVDIEVRKMVEGLEDLVAQYIDIKYVRISILEGELRLTD